MDSESGDQEGVPERSGVPEHPQGALWGPATLDSCLYHYIWQAIVTARSFFQVTLVTTNTNYTEFTFRGDYFTALNTCLSSWRVSNINKHFKHAET